MDRVISSARAEHMFHQQQAARPSRTKHTEVAEPTSVARSQYPLLRMPRAFVCAVMCLATAGCVTEGPPPRVPPATSIPPQPDGLIVNRVVITVAQVLEDRDRNGYYDTIPITVYLFDTPRYAYSIQQPGVFDFSVTDADSGQPLVKWSIPWEVASKAQVLVWAGTCFPFQLDLREVGTDHLDASEALVACMFTPTGGKPVECGSRLTVHVGLTR